MKRSIRSKLFATIALILVLFVSLLWVLNNLYLGKYYIQKKKNSLIQKAKEINSIYKTNSTNEQLQLDKIANMLSSNIEIRNKSGDTVYRSARRLGPWNDKVPKNFIDYKHNQNPKNNPFLQNDHFRKPIIPPPMYKKESYVVNVYKIVVQNDKELGIDFLSLLTGLSNGDSLSIRTPLLSINESVAIDNNFVLFTGAIILIIAGIWAYIFSRRFTKPILELNAITRKISELDFSEKCNVKGNDEIGQLAQSINYLSDELGTAMMQLNIKNAKLEQDIDRERKIDEMRKEFISSVSHELRTPISIIQGYSEGLMTNLAESDEDREFYCDVIMKEANKMNKLVKDLLDISQMESGYFILEKSDFNLSELLDYVSSRVKMQLSEKNISMETEVPEELLVNGDVIRIEQVVTNYLTNAINHVNEKKKIKLTAQKIDDKIKVSVYNTGKNIPEDEIAKIWGSFYKVDKARTRAYGGYGLGLSIVKVIMDAYKNKFGVINQQDGVIFWFELDIAKDNKI